MMQDFYYIIPIKNIYKLDNKGIELKICADLYILVVVNTVDTHTTKHNNINITYKIFQ